MNRASVRGVTIWQDNATLTIIDDHMIALYHPICGGCMMKRKLDGSPITNYEPLCYCYRLPEPENTAIGNTQQALGDVYKGLRTCETMNDVRNLITEIAAREEMKEQQAS